MRELQSSRFERVKLADVVSPGETRDPRTSGKRQFSYVDIASVCNRTFSISSPKMIAGEEAPSRARKVIKTGDVLYATTRPYLKSIAPVPESLDNQICSTGFCVLRPSERILPEWLFYCAISAEVLSQITPLMRGATYPAVTDKDILGAVIPLPPVSEQSRIIGRIKECMERVEEIERLREEVVPERVMLLRSFYSETYNTLLNDHPTKKLGELGASTGGGTPSKSNAAFWKGNIPWISPKDMKKAALSDSALHVSKEAINGSAAKLIPAGSILFVVRGMILAHTLPVAINLVDAAINQDMKAITPGKEVLPEFLATMMRGAEKQLLAKVEIAGHGTCRLQTEHWSALPIPVPTLDEQQEIMAKVAAFESLSDALGADLKPFDSSLRDAILRKAFAGEL